MSDRIYGYDWDGTHLICSLAVAAVRYAEYKNGPAPGEPELRKAVLRVCPHIPKQMQSAIFAQAVLEVAREKIIAREGV